MKILFGVISIALMSGCVPLPPVEPHASPEPTPQQIDQSRAMQSRTLAVGLENIFPRVLDVLMDNGYLVRSANERIGVISFYQQWVDGSQHGAIITQEGSLFFKPIDGGTTQVRAAISQSWQRLEVTGGGKNSTDSGMVGGAQQTPGVEEYKKLLDLLERGLAAKPK